MMSSTLNAIGNLVAKLRRNAKELPPDFDAEFCEIYERCRPFTMTSAERMYALYKAVEYVMRARIPGDFVECGVWRGGSGMIVALSLLKWGVRDRVIHLYDTYEGMSAPSQRDKDVHGGDAQQMFEKIRRSDATGWCSAGLEEVRRNVLSSGYPEANIIFVEGKVEETLPARCPRSISLLRLDTDWYESTYHELVHLYPLLQSGGVLILDDYGHWQGAREATERYFSENSIALLLNRIDYTGRVAVKR
jgi:O-methyltransferase